MYHLVYEEVTPEADAECKRKFSFLLSDQKDDTDYMENRIDVLCADCGLCFGEHHNEVCPKDF